MLIDGHLVLGSNLALLNDLHAGLEHLDKAILYFRSEPYRARQFRLGNNPGVACFTTSAFVLWMLGYPDRALLRANDAVALASELEHPFTMAYGLFHCGLLHLWRREVELVRDRAMGVLHVVEDHDFPIWRAVGTCLLGAANTGMGRVEEGLVQIHEGIALYQGLKTTPPVFWPLLRFVQAGAYAQAGRETEGLVLIDEALEMVGRGSGVTLLPEFHLLKGDLLCSLPEDNGANAELSFQRAFDIAHDLDARTPELRAAVRLYRLRRDQGQVKEGDRVLRAVYDTFTEGFATPDLIEARALFGEHAVGDDG
jgi:hypothetical protein